MYSPVKIWRRQRKLREYLGKKGKIITWTKIYTAGEGRSSEDPYNVALIEIDDHTRFSLQVIHGYEKLDFGQEVKIVLRKLHQKSHEGVIAYGIKCIPL
ncbi:hypothetical protein A2957_01245 [Candidatus Roizmanbacteria bacterium RIFCSPLOWO2_01_FULL_38_11]|uniref:ChsH2 C-terminal OB-fold domain-containing protein n=1 Tax=Candidatus Roizmanbacteria bacterium RIFCSPLOWO2_01_FULL_38_11 TaxID=1802060 RepID=A0A1F7IL91_9BACT|nr:MAG: hypothetical protein A2957_01245 [Candidatus Roizmanbacteria bacterium RIFCSPLOWO2_01_FULL_38_11]